MYMQYGTYQHFYPNHIKAGNMTTGKPLSPIIEDGYTLDGYIQGDGETYPSMIFQYRPSLSHERMGVRRLMDFHMTDTETESLLSNRTAMQLALSAATEMSQQDTVKVQVAGLTRLIKESQERFLDTIDKKSEASEREAAKWIASKVANWGYDIDPNEDNIFKLHPELSGALFGIIIGSRDSDKPDDPKFDESKSLGN